MASNKVCKFFNKMFYVNQIKEFTIYNSFTFLTVLKVKK